jgi:hypothetical protein
MLLLEYDAKGNSIGGRWIYPSDLEMEADNITVV